MLVSYFSLGAFWSSKHEVFDREHCGIWLFKVPQVNSGGNARLLMEPSDVDNSCALELLLTGLKMDLCSLRNHLSWQLY